MDNKIITLSISKYKVEIDYHPIAKDVFKLDFFIKNHLRAQSSQDGVASGEFTKTIGEVEYAYKVLKLLTYIKKITKDDGIEITKSEDSIMSLEYQDIVELEIAADEAERFVKKK